MLSIQQLREKRAAKAKEARKIIDDAGDNFTKEHEAQVDALYAEIDRIDAQVSTIERQQKIEAGLDKPDGVLPGLPTPQDLNDNEQRILNIFLRGGRVSLSEEDRAWLAQNAPRNDQSAGDGAKGGYTVPRNFNTQLIERMKEYGGVRSVATVISTENGSPIDYPTTDETSQEGEIVGENQQVGSTEVSFGLVSIGAWKYSSKVVVVPWELLQDSSIDIAGFITRALAARIWRIQNKHHTIGTGNNQPKGIITAAAVGKTTVGGQTTTLIYDDFVDLEHSVDPAYRIPGECGWMFHDNTLKSVKKLKDSTGRPLWLPGLSSADPDTLLRYRYTINQHMASSIAANAKTVAFGNYKKYLIRDVMGLTLFRFDDSRYAEKGQVGFLCFQRSDGNLIDASNDAIKVVQQASS